MSSSGSVTHWIHLLKGGDAAAAQQLWGRYSPRLVQLARKKLQGVPRRELDEEDVALSAFDSFCRGARRGQFPQLADRANLWPLLIIITARKAIDAVNRQRRRKRGGGAVRGESALENPTADGGAEGGLEEVIGDEPTPEFAAEVAEAYQRLLDRLPDGKSRSIAVWKMEGYTNKEIAAELGCATSTVERKLRAIRKSWGGEGTT